MVAVRVAWRVVGWVWKLADHLDDRKAVYSAEKSVFCWVECLGYWMVEPMVAAWAEKMAVR